MHMWESKYAWTITRVKVGAYLGDEPPCAIDRPSPCHVSQFLGPHLYRSVIIVSVWVGAAPISIGHHLVRLGFCFRDRTYIDRPSSYYLSCHVCLSRGRTHIDRPFSYQFVFSLSRDRTHIDRSFILPIRSVRRPGLCFSMTFRVTFSRFGI